MMTAPITDTTHQTSPGKSWNLSSPAAPAKWDAPPGTTLASATPCARFLGAGAPWRHLPTDYGHRGSTYNRFRNRQKDGTWGKLLDALTNDPDLEWLMIDGSYVKAHQYGTGAVGDNQAVGRTKGG